MWALVRKEIILTLGSKQFYVALGVYWIVLFYLMAAFQPKDIAEAAYVFVAFLVTAVVGSISEGVESKYKLERLYLSLPVTRATLVHASFVNALIFTLGGILYTAMAGWLIVTLLPERFLKNTSTMSLEEMLFVLFIMACNAVVHTPLNFTFGSLSQKKVLFFFLIFTTILFSFWLAPSIFVILAGESAGLDAYKAYGVFAPVLVMVDLLRNPSMWAPLAGVMGLLLYASMRLSISRYKRRDV